MDPICLVVGCAEVGKSSIISSVCGRSAPEIGAAGLKWGIDTKYYTARVQVVEHQVPHESATVEAACSRSDELAWARPEALIMVIDSSDVSSFTALRNWALRQAREGKPPGSSSDGDDDDEEEEEEEGAEEKEQDDSDVSGTSLLSAEVKLLLATKADVWMASGGVRQRPPWLSEAMDWCSETGIEYIEVCPKNPELDADLELEGDQQVCQCWQQM
jgi:hypothetical protein